MFVVSAVHLDSRFGLGFATPTQPRTLGKEFVLLYDTVLRNSFTLEENALVIVEGMWYITVVKIIMTCTRTEECVILGVS